MTKVNSSPEIAHVQLTLQEVRVIMSCIGEAIEALGQWEFDTRVGVSIEEALALLIALGDVEKSMKSSEAS